MTKTLTYKGITGTVTAYEDGFGGHLLDIYGSAHYGGDDMVELEKNFRDMVDFYIEDELAEGRDPYNSTPEAMPKKAARA